MAHEDLQKQYDKDVEQLGEYAYTMWEYQDYGCSVWEPCFQEPSWHPFNKYRRKEPSFVPEYFSGLNWRDALPLVGKKVEVANVYDEWYGPFDLRMVSPVPGIYSFQASCDWWVYLRTCPQTHAHPTITIAGWKLPRSETKPLENDTEYYLFDSTDPTDDGVCTWKGDKSDLIWLESGCIHLDPDRRQAWADWWQNTVMKAVKGDK